MVRLDKWLAHGGAGSRKEVKALLKSGRVEVNGIKEKNAALQLDSSTDTVALDGVILPYEEFVYYLLNKPSGVITATEDNTHKTVLDLFEKKDLVKDLFPVGRLDKDTEGLLLITNDGVLGHRLLSPKHHVHKTYEAIINAPLTDQMIETFETGIELANDGKTLPAKLRVLAEGETPRVEIVITEGKFHQIKRMFHALGRDVLYLQRTKMGPLVLGKTLSLGAYRALTDEEVESLLKLKD